jgi:hypothetical protein
VFFFYQNTGSGPGIGEESEPFYFLNPLNYFNISNFPVYNDSWINGTIDNKVSVANSSMKDYVDNQGFITNANDVVDSSELDNLCSTDGKILKRIGGVWQCATDQTISGNVMNYTKRVEASIVYLDMYIP